MALFKKKTEKEIKTKVKKDDVVLHEESGEHVHMHKPLLIKKPHITEKTLRMSEQNSYVFIIPDHISKTEASKQIEKLYGVNCISSRVTKGITKSKTWKGKKGSTDKFKKVIVTLKQGQKIEITGNT